MDYKKMAKMYGEEKGLDKAQMDEMHAKLDKGEVPSALQEYADKKMDKKDEDKDMDKSLDKAIDLFDELLSKSEHSRQEELLEKAKTGSLDDAEREELVKSLSGAPAKDSLTDEVVKSMTPDSEDGESMAKAMDIDVNGYLSGIHQGITSSLEAVAETLEKGFSERSEREYVLAKGIRDLCIAASAQAKRIETLEKSLAEWGTAPARAPKAQVLEKGFVGQAATQQEQREGLTKSEAYAALEHLGERNVRTVAGMNCSDIAAYIETTGQMPSAAVELELSKIVNG